MDLQNKNLCEPGVNSTIDGAETSAILSGISSTVENKKNEFFCPICFEIIQEAHITKCGHTFCYECITKSVNVFYRCPTCSIKLTKDLVFPNFVLDELITKYRMQHQMNDSPITNQFNSKLPNVDSLKKILSYESQNLSLPDINIMLEILNQRKQLLEAESSAAQNLLLHEFLKHLLKHKEDQQLQLSKEISMIKRDLETVENTLRNVIPCESEKLLKDSTIGEVVHMMSIDAPAHKFSDSIESNKKGAQGPSKANFQLRKRRMYAHFDGFVSSYFTARSNDLLTTIQNCNNELTGMNEDDKMRDASLVSKQNGLDVFRENLIKFSRYNTLQPLATIHYSSDFHVSSTIVSTIDFDKDNEFFAIGGVTKRIKIYDYNTVIKDTIDIHYPSVEMISNSKISCLAWNSFYKNILASSDYEGAVNIWDVMTGQRTKSFHEHEKRCWSVDFNEIDSRLIVSGSDDSRVKLWSIKDEHSIATLEAKANVCCVKFNPKSSCHLAFGSADHDVHYYDLRNMSRAICVFKGHKKAVSYVKFLNSNEIISASTDSQLKLWNVNLPPKCLRSFTGHINEKNFVGLATDGDYIACGSEDNSLYIYYKGLSKQIFNYKIDVNQRVSDLERSNDLNEFVSAVCWRKGCDIVFAANSRGLIKVLKLI